MLFVLFYIFCSVHIMALFELTSYGYMKDYISENEYKLLAIWGNYLFLIVFMLYYVLKQINKLRHKKLNFVTIEPQLRDNLKKNEKLFQLITYFIYFLSFVSLITGISSMLGEAKIILPFHLNGVIDELRGTTYQYIFALFVYDSIIKRGTVDKKCLLLYLIYVVLEIIIRASKGALVGTLFPTIITLFCIGAVNKKLFMRFILPLFLAFLITYPIIEELRATGEFTTQTLINSAKSARTKDSENNSSPYIRVFLTGMYYVKVVDLVDHDYLDFDFRRVPALVLMRGGVNYMTFEIDGFSENDFHSSGVTGLNDALLWGGYPLCWIVLSLLVCLAFYADNSRRLKKKKMYVVIIFLFLYTLLVGRTVTILVDELVLSTFVSLFFKFYITHYYYKKLK